MKFKSKNLREIAAMVAGDHERFHYRSSFFITEFFEECGLARKHDGTSRVPWIATQLADLLDEPSAANKLPDSFARVLRTALDRAEAQDGDEDRSKALEALNSPLKKQGFEGFMDERGVVHFRHIGTNVLSESVNPHRPFTPAEAEKRERLAMYLGGCSEDDLIEQVLLPMFRQLGYHRITAAGHKDKALEYGKDVWMRYQLPSMHFLYFGIQAKKGKLDAAGVSSGTNANVAEIYNQVLMMLGHEVFDPEQSRRVLVDHAFIIAGGDITKQARQWLGEKLDKNKRSQIMFMDREDILNLYTASNLPLPAGALPSTACFDDDIPF